MVQGQKMASYGPDEILDLTRIHNLMSLPKLSLSEIIDIGSMGLKLWEEKNGAPLKFGV